MSRWIPALALTVILDLMPTVATAESVPFTVCKESRTWTRPAPNVQAKIWNDPRYMGLKPETLWEWTHQFISVPPDSGSIQYHEENTSGLWTEGTYGPKCGNGVRNDQWVQLWILQHRIRSVERTGNTYTVTVDPTQRGFQVIRFKRGETLDGLKFVDRRGKLLDVIH